MAEILSVPGVGSTIRRLFGLNSPARRFFIGLGSLDNRLQALESLSQTTAKGLESLSQTTATRISNSEQVIRSLQSLTIGFQNEMQLEFQRLRRGADGGGANERA